jgi:hypothetical protein
MSTGILMPPECFIPAPALDAVAQSVADIRRRYFADYEWHTAVIGPLLLLKLRRGVVGVSMSAARGKVVDQRLRELGLIYPVVPGVGARPMWVFLARSGPLDYRLRSHFFASVLRHTRIPLPPSKIDGRPLQWIVAPDACQREIPELGPLMCVIHKSDAYSTRTWRPKAWRP